MIDIKLSMASALAFAALLMGLPMRIAHAADAAAGGDVFDEECAECHSLKPGKHKKGPSLFGVVGRHAGGESGYAYSDPMRASGIDWSAERLQAYVRAPKTVVPGGKMKYDGGALSDADLADLIEFLSSNH